MEESLLKKIMVFFCGLLLGTVCLAVQMPTGEAAAQIGFHMEKVFMQDGYEIIRGTFKNNGDKPGAVTRLNIKVHLDKSGHTVFHDANEFSNLWIPLKCGESVRKDFLIARSGHYYQGPSGSYQSHGTWEVYWQDLHME